MIKTRYDRYLGNIAVCYPNINNAGTKCRYPALNQQGGRWIVKKAVSIEEVGKDGKTESRKVGGRKSEV